jgi:hypothetical protein
LAEQFAYQAFDKAVERVKVADAQRRELGMDPAQALLDSLNNLSQTLETLKRGSK